MKDNLDKDVDLISNKLKKIQEHVNIILKRWNETKPSNFLEKAKNRTFFEAENDAIDLKQLLIEEKKLNELIKSL